MRGTGRAGVEYTLCLRTVRGLSTDSLSDSLWSFFLTDEMSSGTQSANQSPVNRLDISKIKVKKFQISPLRS